MQNTQWRFNQREPNKSYTNLKRGKPKLNMFLVTLLHSIDGDDSKQSHFPELPQESTQLNQRHWRIHWLNCLPARPPARTVLLLWWSLLLLSLLSSSMLLSPLLVSLNTPKLLKQSHAKYTMMIQSKGKQQIIHTLETWETQTEPVFGNASPRN